MWFLQHNFLHTVQYCLVATAVLTLLMSATFYSYADSFFFNDTSLSSSHTLLRLFLPFHSFSLLPFVYYLLILTPFFHLVRENLLNFKDRLNPERYSFTISIYRMKSINPSTLINAQTRNYFSTKMIYDS